MKNKTFAAIGILLLAVAFCAFAPQARAHDYRRGTSTDHPLRIVAYIVHPVGMALEYVVMRPIHYVVSQPKLDVLCGHEAGASDVYFEYVHGNGKPGRTSEAAPAKVEPAKEESTAEAKPEMKKEEQKEVKKDDSKEAKKE